MVENKPSGKEKNCSSKFLKIPKDIKPFIVTKAALINLLLDIKTTRIYKQIKTFQEIILIPLIAKT